MKRAYTSLRGRRQASVVDAENNAKMAKVPQILRSGIVEDVYTIDNTRGIPSGVYTLYTVRLAPLGQWIQNVPAMSLGGHYNETFKVPNYGPNNPDMQTPPADVQNCEETPYVVGQPVIVGFLNGSQLNPIILGPAPTPWGNSKQTAANYPMKWARHQGTEWWVDKDGNAEIDVKAGGTLTVKIGGVILCKISGGEVDLGSDSSIEPTIMGDAFKNYIENTLLTALNSHVHTGVQGGPGMSGTPAASFTNPPSSVYTTVAKVK
ncbi:Uncharacterised protein [uncultured archaeon]|nr:Uncharacterised protein [uncultured archaeon]